MQLRALVIITLILMALSAGSAWGAPQPGTLEAKDGNPHNLSAGGGAPNVSADSETRVCVFCHTPHGASMNSVLWNRGASSTTFPLYGNGTANIAIIQDPNAATQSEYGVDYPNGATRMCMSCHDGATAIGNVLVGPQIATTPTRLSDLGSGLAVGIVDLSVAHPVSFNYDASRAAINAWHAANATGKSYALVDPQRTPLENGTHMQCTTCHDPHLDTSTDSTYGFLPFWRYQGGGSSYDGVCQNCHNATPSPTAMQ